MGFSYFWRVRGSRFALLNMDVSSVLPFLAATTFLEGGLIRARFLAGLLLREELSNGLFLGARCLPLLGGRYQALERLLCKVSILVQLAGRFAMKTAFVLSLGGVVAENVVFVFLDAAIVYLEAHSVLLSGIPFSMTNWRSLTVLNILL